MDSRKPTNEVLKIAKALYLEIDQKKYQKNPSVFTNYHANRIERSNFFAAKGPRSNIDVLTYQ